MLLLRIVLLVSMVVFFTKAHAESIDYYLPKIDYDNTIGKPESVLGFNVGDRHIRHDQLLQYFRQLEQQSSRVKLTDIGKTTGHRSQILATISSEKNLANLEKILANRAKANDDEQPLVVWLGYSVHGDEISGSNASLLVAYYLAAGNSDEVQRILDNTIIVMEPSVNPDGMDRFEHWANTFRSKTENIDANHIEHHQDWPSGRVNQYWFDLNRDWLFLTQQESQNRMKFYHQYQPNVLADFHEMGANSTYFFQPGIPSRTNPLTPKENVLLTENIATYHAKALDNNERLYYSQESFDDFFYGKGSTFPDINAAVGILFEQASSRGYKQESINGVVSLAYGIKNHVLTSLSTIDASLQNKQRLTQYRAQFYQDAIELAKKQNFDGYLIHEAHDSQRLARFLSVLVQQQIDVYPLTDNYAVNNQTFAKQHSYYVPLAQKQYRVIEAIFKRQTTFKDPTFYDVSGWTLPLAMNIHAEGVKKKRGLKIADQPIENLAREVTNQVNDNALAIAFEWHEFNAAQLLYKLQQAGLVTRVATQGFTANVGNSLQGFSSGTIVIPAALQQHDNWQQKVIEFASEQQIKTQAITSGLTSRGPDLGSSSFKPIDNIKVLMVGGSGVSQYEAGEMAYYFDTMLAIPLTIVDMAKLGRVDLSSYSHVIMVDGNYNALSESASKNIQSWLNKGGVLFSQKRATRWAAKATILNASFVSQSSIKNLFDSSELQYQDKEALSAKQRIAGAIFNANIDSSHPLFFGYKNGTLPLFKNSNLIMEAPSTPFITLARYTQSPLLSGYTAQPLEEKLAGNAAIVAHNVGRGRIIASTDNLVFRGHWLGTAKIVSNSLFFAKAFSASSKG